MTIALYITVAGRPAPQGSKRHVGRGIMVESSKHVQPWRDAVRAEAAAAMLAQGLERFAGPVRLDVTFYFPRPASHFGTGRNAGIRKATAPQWPAGPPDLSKLIRSTEDALSAAGVWEDDARVVFVEARKKYGDPLVGLPGMQGATIEVRPA